jgi:hypothetical protein
MNDIIEHELVPQTAVQVRAQVTAIQEVLHAVMKKDVHYGIIPGTKKPTLYKAGAEILLTTFRIAVDPEIEDLSTDDEIRYRVKLRGIANAEMRLGNLSGHVVGAGVGECSTDEEKYKWRACHGDHEWADTAEDRRRIKWGSKWGQNQGERVETQTRQIRTNPADLANTVLKMAKKRAQIDLCLTALSASDVFDQDLEDLAPENTQGPISDKAQSSPPRRRDESDGMATAAQCGLLRARLNGGPFVEADLCKQFDIPDLERLPFAKVNDAIAWIASQ